MSAQNTGGTSSPPAGTTGSGSGGMAPSDSMSSPARKRARQFTAGAAIGIGVVLLAVGIGGGYFLGAYLNKSSTATIDVTETGSTLLEPMEDIWGPAYTSTVNSHVVISPTGGGSGQGQSEAGAGTIDIGGSDAYTVPTKVPGVTEDPGVVDVPVAISSQLVVYNLGMTLDSVHLNMNGTVLAKIFEGTLGGVTPPAAEYWNSAGIQNANPTRTLPDTAITPVVRSDSSGDTDLFSTYCDMSYSGWTYENNTKAFINTVPPNAKTGDGNIGILSVLKNLTGGIGYVGISYLSEIKADGLGWANLGDNAANTPLGGNLKLNASAQENYIGWSLKNVSLDANLSLGRLDYSLYGLAINLILGGSPAGPITWAAGEGGTNPASPSATLGPYPDVNLEYTLLKTSPASPSHEAYVVAYEEWVISYGQASKYLDQVNFIPLTPQIQGLDLETLAQVTIAN